MSAQNEGTVPGTSHPPYNVSVEISPMVKTSVGQVSPKPDGERPVLEVPNIDSAAPPPLSVGRSSSISKASVNKTFALVDDKVSARNTTDIGSSSDDAPSNKEITDDTLANSASTQEVLISDTLVNEATTDETLVYDEHMRDRTLSDEPLLNEETSTATISSNTLSATVVINDVTLQSVTTPKESSTGRVQQGKSTRRRYTEVELYLLQKMLFESYGIGKPLRGKERESFRERLGMNPRQLSSWIYYHRRKEHQQLEIFARLYEKKRIQNYEDYLEIHHRCLKLYADTMIGLESTTSLVALYIAVYRH
ncbi:hypothetical protein BJV82DRAFT_666110 [Fennellomyces sp. T-0311]|nr:hypothetical protein BJV82DRAFT_666110 [Fennellomyces sp. T-0311]